MCSLCSLISRGLIFAAIIAFASACDRHSAAEVPENYGHGSSHKDSYTDHKIDSRNDSHSFSDTAGLETGAESPTPSPAH